MYGVSLQALGKTGGGEILRKSLAGALIAKGQKAQRLKAGALTLNGQSSNTAPPPLPNGTFSQLLNLSVPHLAHL